MKQSIALVIFAFAVPFVFGTADEPMVVEVNVGSRIHLRGDPVKGKVVRCTAKMNTGTVLNFPDAINENFCAIDIWESKLDYAGIWILTTYENNTKSYQKKFVVLMSQDVYVKPASYISANAGQWVTVWFDGNDSAVRACTLADTMNEQVYDLLNSKLEDITRYRGCGIRMRATKERAKRWELHRKIGKYVTEHSVFHIAVSSDNGDDGEIIYKRFNLGESAELEVYDKRIVFCQMTRPDGTLTRLQYGRCSFPIAAVSTFHEGIWSVAYALRTKMELLHKEVHVTVWDTESLKATQIPGAGREINLLCRAGVAVLKYCTFRRPDNEIINLPVAVGNDNYSYYGDGYYEENNSRYYGDCGITIHKPSKVDFGSWTCEMGILRGDDVVTRGTVIEVAEARDKTTYKIESSEVIVRSGDSFEIRCKVNTLLDYCWLTSPNGTVYSVLPEARSAWTLEYNGKGFSMGDCGAIVHRSNISDNGNWICHLGISGYGELQSNVSVQATDSYLIAHEKIVRGKNTAKLSCRTYLGEEGTIKYCRWVRPDGSGLNQKDAGRYTTNTKIDSCDLTILAIAPVDIGQWTCAAMLTGSPRVEQWATIELESIDAQLTSTSVVSIVLGCALLTVALMGSFLAVMYAYKCQNSEKKSKRPPPYNLDSYIPRACQADCIDATMGQDYKY